MLTCALMILTYVIFLFFIDQGPELTQIAIEQLQCYAAQFLVNIREKCKMSHTAIEHVINGVVHLLEMYSAIIVVSYNYSLK